MRAKVTSWRAQARAAASAVPPRAILLAGLALFLLYAYPGYMSSDSVLQVSEGRSHILTNSHPPVMAAEWGLLDAVVAGPILMLLLQGGLFLGGLYAIARRVLVPRAAAVAACALFLFPPVLTTMAVIWKDSQMAAYLVAGLACLLAARRRTRLVGWGLVTAGCAMRYNAFAASIPLLVLLFEWQPGGRGWRRYALGLVAAAVSTVVAFGANRVLTVETRFALPAFGDIAGVLAYTSDRSDDELLRVLRGTPLHRREGIQAWARAHYSPRNAYWVDHGDDRLFDAATTPAQQAETTRAWKELIASDWGAYARSRLAGYQQLIGLSDDPLWSPVYTAYVESADQALWIDHDASPSVAQAWLADRFAWLATETPLFRVWVYVVIALALLVLCCRDRLTFALFASGLGYELSFLPAAGTPDFRYSHWLITCTCLAAAWLFVQRATRPR